MDTKVLERIGLTQSEISVYLALLKLGQTTAGPIVDEAKVTRSKIYDILERLTQKGLVGYITKESTKYFSAANPHNILSYLEQKEKEIEEDKLSVQKILPELLLQQTLSNDKKVAEIFLGMRGMNNAFGVLINEFNSKDTYYAFGAGKGENLLQIKLFFEKLHQQRIRKKVKSKIIFNHSSRGIFKSQEKSPLVEVRYLFESTPAAINIYKDYTLIAILNQEPITFLVKNKETADSFREYFKAMWGIAKK
ncbi:MAG: helix-turn-helix domain-containing protein [Candidatus Woesearchaeota archaeon]